MPVRISEALGVRHEDFEREGALDAFIDIDSQFHLDPYLLRSVRLPEFEGAHDTFRAHFSKILRMLRPAKPGGAVWAAASKLLEAPEIPQLGLGFSKAGTIGSGIGPKLAADMAEIAKDIIDAGVDDETIFELVGLIQEGIGADRVSDMTAQIIWPQLLSFSERVARNVGVETHEVEHQGQTYHVPRVQGPQEFMVLAPRVLLRKLPVARDWSDIDRVCAHNQEVRNRVNKVIGSSWKQATRAKKQTLRRVLTEYPDALRDLISQYEVRDARHYNFASDPDGEFAWHEEGTRAAGNCPLELRSPTTTDEVHAVVETICEHYGKLIEDQGLFRVLYRVGPGRKPREERIAQLLFFCVADSYCRANDLDLSPESNSGRGPVDFKVSKGYSARVLVESKLSSNKQLVHGYEKQVPIYQNSESTDLAIFLIVRVDHSMTRIRRVQKLEQEALQRGDRAPKVIVVDGRWKRSASKAG